MALLGKFRAFSISSILLLSFFFVVPTSHAASSYDGVSPTATSCANDATTIRSANLWDPNQNTTYPGGVIEIRYSFNCHTAWARLTINSNWKNTDSLNTNKATIHRNSDGREYTCTVPDGGTSCYTKMVYDYGVTSYAKAYYNYYYSLAGHWWHFTGQTSSY